MAAGIPSADHATCDRGGVRHYSISGRVPDAVISKNEYALDRTSLFVYSVARRHYTFA